MRELRAALASFLSGQEHGICVLRGERDHLPFVYRLLQELEETSADVFLHFPHTFDSAEAYVALVEERIEASGREARGDPAWRLPRRGGARAPGEQMKEVLACARAMLPRGSETPRLVAVLCPLAVEDEAGHRALVGDLALQELGAPPWCSRMRVLVHVPGLQELRLPRFVRALRVDLSSEALAASAAEDASDPSLPREQRAQALLQSAMFELAHRRFEPARTRLDALYGEAQALRSPVLAALALSGLGDVERVAGADEGAIAWYERALVPASEAGAPIVLLTITRHLADLYFKRGRITDAETFYDGAQQLAAVIPEPETQATALRGRGLAQQRRGAAASEWAASFAAAAEVARDNDRAELLAELRQQLAASRGHGLPTELRRTIDGLLGGAA